MTHVTKETYARVLATLERIYGPASYDARLAELVAAAGQAQTRARQEAGRS